LSFAEEVWVPSTETKCQIEGWSKEPHQNGLQVRSSTEKNAEVIGTLPGYVINFDSHNFGIEFDIIGSDHGWLKISGAKDDPNRSNLPLRATYSGIGWIPGESVEFMVQSGSGYLRPDPESTKALDLKGDWLTSMGRIERVIACSGEWVLLDYSLSKQRNQETTCETSWP
jgi:hypothetical protein